jgi:hypothetical protein
MPPIKPRLPMGIGASLFAFSAACYATQRMKLGYTLFSIAVVLEVIGLVMLLA